MYCEKCNKNFPKNAKYCNICGGVLEEKILSEKELPRRKTKNKKTGLIVSVIIGLILSIGSTVFFVISLFNYLDKMGTIEYIELGNDKIPTIYMINESIQIDSYYKETTFDEPEIELEYYEDLYRNDMVNSYVKFLEEKGFTYIEKDYDEWFLVKESIDEGKVIIVNIYENYDYDGEIYFTIIYEKETSPISNYIKEKTYKRVGEEKYGFIDIDSSWQPYVDMELVDMIQYGSQNEFVSLYYIENPDFNAREYMNEIYSNVSKEGGKDLKVTEVTVDGYDAYQLSARYEYYNSYIVIWCFQDDNNIMHYIEIDSNKHNSDVFSKIESYSVLK